MSINMTAALHTTAATLNAHLAAHREAEVRKPAPPVGTAMLLRAFGGPPEGRPCVFVAEVAGLVIFWRVRFPCGLERGYDPSRLKPAPKRVKKRK